MINWEIIIAVLGVILGIINFWYTRKRTRKSETEKLEEFRHKLILRAQNLIIEIERKDTKLLKIYQKFEDVESKIHFQEIINYIEDIKISSENLLEYFNGVKLGLEDKNDYNSMAKLRDADLALNKYEKQYDEYSLIFNEMLEITSKIYPSILEK